MTYTTEAIWIGFRRRLYGYIRARSRSEQDAEDILQDVFVKVHRRLESVDDESRLAGWLFQITHNTIIDYYRKRRPTPVPNATWATVEPDVPVAEQQLAPFLTELIEELPEPYRDALYLTQVDGLTQREMGDRLGLSPSGAKSRVQRGRAIMRDALTECCRIELDCSGHVVDFEPLSPDPLPADCVCASQPAPMRASS